MELAKCGINPPPPKLLMGCWPYLKLAKKCYRSKIGSFKSVKKAVLGELEEIQEYPPTPTKPVFLNPSLYHNNHQHDRRNVTIQNYHAWYANCRYYAHVVQVNFGSLRVI